LDAYKDKADDVAALFEAEKGPNATIEVTEASRLLKRQSGMN
jgi:hypothetical protein